MSDYLPYIFRVIRIPAIIMAALIATRYTGRVVKKVKLAVIQGLKKTDSAAPLPELEINKRADTIAGILSTAIIVVIWGIAGLMLLEELGFDPKPFLAGAGIIGVAVGFGSQNLVRDVISGLFMILENQIRVGDVAILNGTGGLVESMHLRTTVLRGVDGTVHVFPNGTITSLSNMTREFSYYVFNLGVAYKEDVDRVMMVLKEIGTEMMADEKYRNLILEPLEVLGVDSFGDSAVMIKARIKTVPLQQWPVGREMNRRIKKRFDEANIEMPFPHRTLYFGEGLPASLKMGPGREDLKEVVRELMQEMKAP
ncbi:MAG: mechanosensitive ion channel family protein [Pseudomonadota bacterium]